MMRKPYIRFPGIEIYQGDSREVLRDMETESVLCIVTSPPYWGLRDYGVEGQLGLEATPEEYVVKMVEIFRECKRVLRKDGTCFLNLGDSYMGSGGAHKEHHENPGLSKSFKRGGVPKEPKGYRRQHLKPKDLVGIPWRTAFALQADGWYLRQDIIWHKNNPMPESVKDRCTKAHEYVFLLTKSAKYYFDNEAIREATVTCDSSVRDRDTTKLNNTPGRSRMGGLVKNNYDYRNKRSVWTVATKPYKGAHFATFPEELITPMILAGCPKGGTVLDPFMGSGTTLKVAQDHGRHGIGIELNEEYIKLANNRLEKGVLGGHEGTNLL